MNNFGSLVHNENIKIYSRSRTWVMLIILAGVGILLPVLLRFASASGLNVWDSYMTTFSVAFSLNIIFTVVIAADAVAGEFTWGTIKLLLIRPWSRSKILLSKYTAMVLFSLASTVFLTVVALAASFLLADSNASPTWSDTTRVVILDLVYRYAELFITVTLAFMISSVFRSSALAIGMSMFLMFAQMILPALLPPDRYEWARYLIFNHMNLRVYIHSDTGAGGSTLGFSLLILAAYYALFMVVAWSVFRRRDVAG